MSIFSQPFGLPERGGSSQDPGTARLCTTLISSKSVFWVWFPTPGTQPQWWPPWPRMPDLCCSASLLFLPLVTCSTAVGCERLRQVLWILALSVYGSWSIWAFGNMEASWEPSQGAEPGSGCVPGAWDYCCICVFHSGNSRREITGFL